MNPLTCQAPTLESSTLSGSSNPRALSSVEGNSLTSKAAMVSSQLTRPGTSESARTIADVDDSRNIEADDDKTLVGRPDDEDGSIASDEDISSTISLKSSVTSFKYENGRRYHAQNDAPYFLPNDDVENDRLDLFHHIMTLRCDERLHFAPIGPEPKRILDLGTGTGIWAIQMGDAYPSATIIGNDLSPVQPNVVPPNVIFEIDDIEAEWCFSRPFDYVHCRYLAGSITNWPRLMEQAFKYTRPGGWVEFQDFDMRFYSTDNTYTSSCSLAEWSQELINGLKNMGFEPEPGPKLEGWVREASFMNIRCQCLPIPVGIWPKDMTMKEIGACNLSMFLEGLEAMSLRALIYGRDWTREQVLGFLPAVRRDLRNKRVHAMHNFHIVWAQKPARTKNG